MGKQKEFDKLGFSSGLSENTPFSVFLSTETNRMLGGWVSLPEDPDLLEEAIQILTDGGIGDWAVADTEAFNSAFNQWAMYEVKLEDLNNYADEWSGRPEEDYDKAAYLVENGYVSDLPEAMEHTDDLVVIDRASFAHELIHNYFSMDQLVDAFDEDRYIQDIKHDLESDEAHFAEDIAYKEIAMARSDGNIDFFDAYIWPEDAIYTAQMWGYDFLETGPDEIYWYTGR